ncbi:MAG: MotA/TolQ/ExbB proton channel family protein [Fibrobacterota bacterium]
MNTKNLLALACLLASFYVSEAALFGDADRTMEEKKLVGRIRALGDEVKTLQKQKDSLEAARWQRKYDEVEMRKERESRIKRLDSEYNSLLNKKNSSEESLLRAKQQLTAEEGKYEDAIAGKEAFRESFLTGIQNEKEKIGNSFPYKTEDYIASLNSVSEKAASGDLREAMADFYSVFLNRSRNASEAGITEGKIITEEGKVFQADVLRLGTVFMAKSAADTSLSQFLVHTGRLSGSVYQWRSDVSQGIVSDLSKSLEKLKSKEKALLPVDVLQTKKAIEGFTGNAAGGIFASIYDTFKSGGIVMIPLLLLVLWALYIVAERMLYYRQKSINSYSLITEVDPYIKKKDYSGAREICEKSMTSLGRVLVPIFHHAQEGGSRITAEKSLEEAMLREVPDLEKKISTLGVIGSAAPLLGLLGTVAGMITLFKVITLYGTNDPKLLAGGISEALVTTETGLIIAIPVMLLHNMITNKFMSIQDDLNRFSMEMLNRIWDGDCNG